MPAAQQRLLHSSPPLQSLGPAVRPPSFAGCGTTPPRRFPAATTNNLCVVCCAKYNKYLKKHPTPHTETCPTSGGKPHSGVSHATSTSVSMSAAHACRLELYLCIYVYLCFCVNKFLNFFNFLCVFLSTYFGPWPSCSKISTFLKLLCQKLQSLTNQ